MQMDLYLQSLNTVPSPPPLSFPHGVLLTAPWRTCVLSSTQQHRENPLQFFPQLSKNLQLIKIGLDQFLHLPGYSTLNRKYSPAFQMHAITNQNWNRVRHFLLSLASNPQL
jgi:hypothetical protein